MMKKSLLSILVMLLALPCVAQSNRIYMEDFEIMPDSTLVVPVILANESPTRGFQFDLTVPAGLKKVHHELTDYSDEYFMNLICQKVQEDLYAVMVYPSTRICYPVDTAVVMTFTFKADADFRGGDILISGCKGSTIDNKTFPMEGGVVQVTVPTSSLIGIPVDQHQEREQYFNLQGMPIGNPASSPVAICVTTGSNGQVKSRKVMVQH